MVSVQEEMTATNDRMIAAGRNSAATRKSFEAQKWRLKSVIPVLQARQKSAGYRLAALLGDLPGTLPADVLTCQQVPILKAPIPIGDGRAFLARRPDIRAAEATVKAATARIGVATGDLYPHIMLGLSGGSTGLLSHIGNADTYKYSLGPLISWDFPERGAVKARIRQAEARDQAALANFDKTVLDALRDAESSLSVYARDLDQNDDLKRAVMERALSRSDSERLQALGRQSLMNTLEARRSQLLSEQELAGSDAKLAADQIVLFWILGGGWK